MFLSTPHHQLSQNARKENSASLLMFIFDNSSIILLFFFTIFGSFIIVLISWGCIIKSTSTLLYFLLDATNYFKQYKYWFPSIAHDNPPTLLLSFLWLLFWIVIFSFSSYVILLPSCSIGQFFSASNTIELPSLNSWIFVFSFCIYCSLLRD